MEATSYIPLCKIKINDDGGTNLEISQEIGELFLSTASIEVVAAGLQEGAHQRNTHQ